MPGNNSVVCRPKHTAMYRNATGIVVLKQELGVLKGVLVGLLRRSQESHMAVISMALTMGTHARSATLRPKSLEKDATPCLIQTSPASLT